MPRQHEDGTSPSNPRMSRVTNNGKAGTGKSTIARTIAKKLIQTKDSSTRLNASFFSKKGEAIEAMSDFSSQPSPRSSQHWTEIWIVLSPRLSRHTPIRNKALSEQFGKLTLQPLRQAQQPMTITMVVDALDECDECDDARLIISLLPQLREIPHHPSISHEPARVPIHLGFKELTCKYQEIALHKFRHSIIKQDLATFFIHELRKLRDKQNKIRPRDNQLKPSWPKPAKVQLLVHMASPRFIIASTVCSFIDSNGILLEKQLVKMVEYRHITQLEAVYAPILNQLLSGVIREG
ncbi:unnamed protein product [Clonostachys rosea]|uniref:Nephrocystin 3-like N-terminal domain-containing protein n=1 Tax=Bionectria ochroleuca TaxID=29856 RepID=A0ABY6TSI7_BIOOC|nr:unnamed protein product [Clonostachys rosea]